MQQLDNSSILLTSPLDCPAGVLYFELITEFTVANSSHCDHLNVDKTSFYNFTSDILYFGGSIIARSFKLRDPVTNNATEKWSFHTQTVMHISIHTNTKFIRANILKTKNE